MKSLLKKKIALMLLEALKRKGLKCAYDVIPPVIPPDFQEAQDLLGRLGYEFVTGRRFPAPKDTSKEIYLKMIIHGWREAMRSLRNDLSTARSELENLPPNSLNFTGRLKKIEDNHQEINDVIWVRMDMDTAMKSLALGFLP